MRQRLDLRKDCKIGNSRVRTDQYRGCEIVEICRVVTVRPDSDEEVVCIFINARRVERSETSPREAAAQERTCHV